MSEWFERSFGSDYMIVYRHRDWQNAAFEVANMASWLMLPQGAQLLDIGCGMGRHALALHRLGYTVTGVDLSQELLDEARRNDPRGDVEWIRGDMRELPVAAASCDATVNLFTSFGYFDEEADNQSVLAEIHRVLRPSGKFLIDYLNAQQVRDSLVPYSERYDEASNCRIEERRSIDGLWVRKSIEIRADESEVRTYSEQVRLFELEWFETALAQAGLAIDTVYGDYDGSPYDQRTSKRLIMLGRTTA